MLEHPIPVISMFCPNSPNFAVRSPLVARTGFPHKNPEFATQLPAPGFAVNTPRLKSSSNMAEIISIAQP